METHPAAGCSSDSPVLGWKGGFYVDSKCLELFLQQQVRSHLLRQLSRHRAGKQMEQPGPWGPEAW